jgi:hypothetical protein
MFANSHTSVAVMASVQIIGDLGGAHERARLEYGPRGVVGGYSASSCRTACTRSRRAPSTRSWLLQQMRELLECAWPAALDTARQPFRSATWIASLMVIAGRDGEDFGRTRRLGVARFETAMRREIARRGGRNRPSALEPQKPREQSAEPPPELAGAIS